MHLEHSRLPSCMLSHTDRVLPVVGTQTKLEQYENEQTYLTFMVRKCRTWTLLNLRFCREKTHWWWLPRSVQHHWQRWELEKLVATSSRWLLEWWKTNWTSDVTVESSNFPERVLAHRVTRRIHGFSRSQRKHYISWRCSRCGMSLSIHGLRKIDCRCKVLQPKMHGSWVADMRHWSPYYI